MLRKAPFCMGNFSKNFFKFLFARRFEDSISPTRETKGNCVREAPFLHLFHLQWFRFPLPGKRRGTASGKRLFCISSILGGFDSPYRGNEGERHQEPGRALFSYKRGPLAKYPTGIFCNSPPKMRPTDRGIPPIAMGGQGSSPWVFAAASVGALIVCHWHTAPSPG